MGEEKILIVDDEEDVRILLEAQFRLGGFECLSARNGLEAIEIAKAERPSLVILDMVMPGVDGLGVYKALKADDDTKDIPIIAYTAQTPDTLMAREGVEAVDILTRGMEALDVVHFMVKPCDHEELIAVVKRLLNNSKQVAGEPKTS